MGQYDYNVEVRTTDREGRFIRSHTEKRHNHSAEFADVVAGPIIGIIIVVMFSVVFISIAIVIYPLWVFLKQPLENIKSMEDKYDTYELDDFDNFKKSVQYKSYFLRLLYFIIIGFVIYYAYEYFNKKLIYVFMSSTVVVSALYILYYNLLKSSQKKILAFNDMIGFKKKLNWTLLISKLLLWLYILLSPLMIFLLLNYSTYDISTMNMKEILNIINPIEQARIESERKKVLKEEKRVEEEKKIEVEKERIKKEKEDALMLEEFTKEGISTKNAQFFISEGISLKQAKMISKTKQIKATSLIELPSKVKIITDTIKVSKWQEAGFSKEDEEFFKEEGTSLKQAKKMKKTKKTAPKEKNNWKDSGFTKKDSQYYIKTNTSVTEAKKWKAAGFRGKDAYYYIHKGISLNEAIERLK